MAIEAAIPVQRPKPACIVTASTIEHRQSTEPTERSMPPEMMTMVMPKATIATKVALRVMLKRFLWVRKASVANDRKTQASSDRDQHPERLAVQRPREPGALLLRDRLVERD